MEFAIGIGFGALLYSLLNSLMANIRDTRPGMALYEVQLDDVANDNTIPAHKDFTFSA